MSDSSPAVMPKGEASSVPSWASKHLLDSTNNNHSRCVFQGFLDGLHFMPVFFEYDNILFQERLDEHKGGTFTTRTPHSGRGGSRSPSLGLGGRGCCGRSVADDGRVHGGRGGRRCRGRQRKSRGRRRSRGWGRSGRASGTPSGARAGADASPVRHQSTVCHFRHGGLHQTYR